MRNIIYIIILFLATELRAEQLRESKSYPFPVEVATQSYSGSFGEMRSNHLHSGVDIRTDGVVGKRVVSIDDGYVSRISLSTGGFGLALYVAHPNGTTSVYAHLDRLTDEMERYLHDERYRLKQHTTNLYPAKDQFPVKGGELIAYSGNSGSSSGPHLHFEVRNSKLQKPLNPVKMGVIPFNDKIAPKLNMLYYVEVDRSKSGVERQQIQRQPLRRGKDGIYRITRSKEMWIGREGYFVVACTDMMAGSYSVFGLYSLEGRLNGKTLFQFKQDGFEFDMSRYVNALSYYPFQIDYRGEIYQLRRQTGVPSTLYAHLSSDGMVGLKPGERGELEIIATDHSGNRSTLKVTLYGKDSADIFKSSQAEPKEVVAHDRESKFTRDGLRVEFVKGSTYRNYEFKAERVKADVKMAAGCRKVSDLYRVLSREVPLHRPMKIAIKCKLPDSLSSKAVVVQRNHKGDLSAIKSSYDNGEVIALSSSAGEFFVAIDSEAPTIEGGAVVDGRVNFTVKDNFTGVAKYSATLNGEWIALDMSRSTISHTLRDPNVEGELILTVTDLCGNTTEKRIDLKR
ncbi:MAG: M23 family metallopeptidase [Rikenellaceae bacterium]